jgi:membrane protein YqaA with SNARE-associated domain
LCFEVNGLKVFHWMYNKALTSAKHQHAERWFTEYGGWVVFVAGFSFLPYKLVTVGAGLMHLAFLPFIIASFIGRASLFFLVAGLMYWGGEKMQQKLRDIVDWLGRGTVARGGVLNYIYG